MFLSPWPVDSIETFLGFPSKAIGLLLSTTGHSTEFLTANERNTLPREMQRVLARFGLRAYACFTRAMRMRVTKALGLSSWSCLLGVCCFPCLSLLAIEPSRNESTRIRICLIDRLLDWELARYSWTCPRNHMIMASRPGEQGLMNHFDWTKAKSNFKKKIAI